MENIGIQGGEASYHELAAHQLHPGTELAYYETFEDLFQAVKRQQIGSAVVAIANNRVQFIPEPYDLLLSGSEALANRLVIEAETYLRVEHALMAPHGASLEDIREVHSQPPAIGQCRQFLDHRLPKARIVEQHDTAASAKMVAEIGDPTKAAIASLQAAKKYGLTIVEESVQDDRDNITRFIELKNLHGSKAIKGANKTTMVLETPHEAGALVDALLPFKERGINLANLHSRTIPNTAFHNQFFVEFDAGTQEERTKEVMKELIESGHYIRILGSYVSAEIPMSKPVAQKKSKYYSRKQAEPEGQTKV
ncbi:MAG: prephenate dehydratase [Candidatus Saccharimonadales bacterium]